MEIDSTSSTSSKIPSSKSTLYRHNNNCPFKRIQASQVQKSNGNRYHYINLSQQS